jgi:hypothetical protein
VGAYGLRKPQDLAAGRANHGVSPKHLQRYLSELQLRFNERWNEADLFSPVLRAAISADPFPDRRLTAEPTG